MAARSTKMVDGPDLDQSIQIALDAAEASMDVTAEFERISTQFEETTRTAQRLEKMARVALIAATAIAVLAVFLMALIWQRSSSGLERLTATNTELLTILGENVATMDEKLAPLVALDAQVTRLRDEMVEQNKKIAIAAQALEESINLKTALVDLQDALNSVDTVDNAQIRADAVKQEIGDRVATLNGELAMNVSTVIRDTMAAQSKALTDALADLSKLADASGNSIAAQELARIKEQTESRLQEMTQRLNRLQGAPSGSRPSRSQPAQQPDIIKFP